MEVRLIKRAVRQFGRLSRKDQNKIRKKLSLLESEPLAGKKLSGELMGTRSLRAWPYRIIYFIEEEQKVAKVISIIHRQKAYKS